MRCQGELQPVFEPCVLNREGKPTRKLERAEFVDRVAEELCLTPVHGELVCQAVFVSLRRELPEKLARDVAHQLPHGLAQLWLGAPPVEPTAEHTLSAYAARQAIAGEIDSAGPLPTGVTSEDAFSAVMCAFSERLSRGQAREVFLGLPEPLRPPVERCMLHRAEPGVAFGREELLRRIGDHLHLDAPRAEAIAHAVLAGLKRVLPEKAALDTENQLPADLLELWKRC